MNALTPIAAPARYCDALRIAWHSTNPAEVMQAHCAALDELLANPAALASLAGRGQLTALAATLRLAAPRFAAPGAASAAPASAAEPPPHARRIDFRWILDQQSVFRPLLRQYGIEADHFRRALLACCQGEEWRRLTPAEVAAAATNGGYDDRHIKALAASLRAGPLARRVRTDAVLTLLDAAAECLA